MSRRVAVIHDWLTGMRGGEAVLEGILDLFPEAEIFTLFHFAGSVSEKIESRRIHTSSLQRLAAGASDYRRYLPLFPRAIREWDLSGFDLVISSSHCVAKGVDAKGCRTSVTAIRRCATSGTASTTTFRARNRCAARR